MLDTPQITQTAAQLTAVIRLTIPREEIRNVMGPGINEVMAAIAAQGIAPAGPWLTHHLRMNPDTFDFEIAVPVTSPVTAAGRVKPGELRAATVARTVYHGPYEGLGDAWGEFMTWIDAEGHTPAPDLWEVYLAGPESNPDPATWRTELNRPLIQEGLPAGLAQPALRALAAAGYTRLDQLANVREVDLKALHGMGPKALGILRDALRAKGQSFKP
jgi:effector-binding domain-containing protein